MLHLKEDLAKKWLREMDCPVPRGAVATTPQAAARVAQDLGSEVVVKALIPSGRRGKAGAILSARDAKETGEMAENLLGSTVNEYIVRKVLVESKIKIARELFLSFIIADSGLEMLVCARGGVDIEERTTMRPGEVVRAQVSPIKGVSQEFAAEQWSKVAVSGDLLPRIAQLTSRLYDAFVRGDCLLLELNPIVVTEQGDLSVVGSMMGIDDKALFRHPNWVHESDEETLPENDREKSDVDRCKFSWRGTSIC